MRLQTVTNEILMATDVWRQLRAIGVLLLWVLGWFTISIVTFLRRNFGERYLAWVNLFFGYGVVASFASFGNLAGASMGFGFSKLMVCVYAAFIALSIYHQIVIRRRNRAGVRWHSLYEGTPWLLPLGAVLRCSPETVYKWIEPGFVLSLGLLFWKFDRALSIWLLISSLALLVHEHLSYYFQRQRILDATDAQIESEFLNEVCAGKPVDETAGFTLAMSNIDLMDRAEAAFKANEMGVADAMAGLDPKMREFVSQPHDQETFHEDSETQSV